MKKTLLALNFTTAFGVFVYWSLVFFRIFPVQELVPGYSNWFMSFPLPDFWMAVNALLAFYFLCKNSKKAVLFCLLSGSSLIFLGLYALAYGIRTRLLFVLTLDEIIEIAIKLYCLWEEAALLLPPGIIANDSVKNDREILPNELKD